MTALADDTIPFWKMNGLGNEIVVLDMRESGRIVTENIARQIANDSSTAFDQLMIIEPPHGGDDAFMTIRNTDGSLAEACGNGTRCVADILMRELNQDQLSLATSAGPLAVWRTGNGDISVDMGTPRFGWQEIPLAERVEDTLSVDLALDGSDLGLGSAATVNMGNPHAVFWLEDVETVDLARLGPLLEHHAMFPERANISLAHLVSDTAIDLKVWERGAGLTRACGSAACATLVLAARTGRTGRQATIYLPGGPLAIEWREDDHVIMTGPFEYEVVGTFAADRFPLKPNGRTSP